MPSNSVTTFPNSVFTVPARLNTLYRSVFRVSISSTFPRFTIDPACISPNGGKPQLNRLKTHGLLLQLGSSTGHLQSRRHSVRLYITYNLTTKMHSSLVRIQNVFGFFTTVAFTLGALIALSVVVSPQTPSATLSMRNVQVYVVEGGMRSCFRYED